MIEKDTLLREKSTHHLIHHLSAVAGLDYVASSVEDDIREKIPAGDKISVHSSVPVNLRYSFSFTNPNIRHFLPGGYQGISVGMLNLGGAQAGGVSRAYRNIGYPVLVYIFQGGPFWHLRENLSLDYEWNFGTAIGWKPYSEHNKFFNLTVGSQVNAYLNLNFALRWQLKPQLGLIAGIGVSHFSNGNTSFPNPGINSFGIRLGVVYTFNPLNNSTVENAIISDSREKPDTIADSREHHRMTYDVSLWGATRKRVYRGGETPVLLPGHFACAGISFAPMVRLNKWWRVGGSLDLQYDHSAGMPKTESLPSGSLPGHPSFWKQTSVGVSAHGELQMPIFAVNVGIGYNILAPWENKGSYQNITLKTYLCRFLYLNVGYQLRNFQQQSSLMLGLGLTLD